ncbi:MAG: hypothetical protein K0B10_11230 [Vicingaceae bacterium]|nr:hypothetical protein [Vicingaceae bacterium]
MALIPYYKTTIESKLTPKEVCQKLALFVEQKNMDEVYLRDFLSLGVTDMLIYGDYKKLFMGKYNENEFKIRTSTAYGSMGGFNLNYLHGKIKESDIGGSVIDLKIQAPKLFNYLLLSIGIFILLIQILMLDVGIYNNNPLILTWFPSIMLFVGYLFVLVDYNMGLTVYNERLIPHLKSLSIQELIKKRDERKQRRKTRRR